MLSDTDILNIKCELYFQTSRSGAQIVRRRQNKSSAILVAIIVVFLICHIHRLIFRIYELAHPEKSLYKHYLKCEIFCPFIFTKYHSSVKTCLHSMKSFSKMLQNLLSIFHVCLRKLMLCIFFHYSFRSTFVSPQLSAL